MFSELIQKSVVHNHWQDTEDATSWMGLATSIVMVYNQCKKEQSTMISQIIRGRMYYVYVSYVNAMQFIHKGQYKKR
jgi:hypothetical protein